MRFSRTLLLLVLWIVAFGAAKAHGADAQITQLKLQHTWCYGRCPIDEMTLNADGSAQFSGVSNSAREGLWRGQIASEKYNELADLLRVQNFFELRPQIGSGNIDAPDTIVSVMRGGLPYAVALRWGASQALQSRFENAFAQASAQIVWAKDDASSSGVRGAVRRDLTAYEARIFADRKPPINSVPMRFALVTLTSATDPKISFSTRSDQEGRFQFFAPLGRYSLDVSDTNFSIQRELDASMWLRNSAIVEIEPNQFAPATLQMRDFNTKPEPIATSRKLPRIEAADLNGQPFVLPGDFSAPRTLLLIAFEREQQQEIDSWVKALKLSPVDKDWFEVPVFGEMNAQHQKSLDNAMRARVLALYVDRLKFLKSLGLNESSTGTILILVVSPQGEV